MGRLSSCWREIMHPKLPATNAARNPQRKSAPIANAGAKGGFVKTAPTNMSVAVKCSCLSSIPPASECARIAASGVPTSEFSVLRALEAETRPHRLVPAAEAWHGNCAQGSQPGTALHKALQPTLLPKLGVDSPESCAILKTTRVARGSRAFRLESWLPFCQVASAGSSEASNSPS